jgi:hypothetical protein
MNGKLPLFSENFPNSFSQIWGNWENVKNSQTFPNFSEIFRGSILEPLNTQKHVNFKIWENLGKTRKIAWKIISFSSLFDKLKFRQGQQKIGTWFSVS